MISGYISNIFDVCTYIHYFSAYTAYRISLIMERVEWRNNSVSEIMQLFNVDDNHTTSESSVQWHHFQRPWTTSNAAVKVTPLFNTKYLINGMRYKSNTSSSSSRMRFMSHNWSATKQRLHLQSVAEISRHSVLSGDRIRQCETLSNPDEY